MFPPPSSLQGDFCVRRGVLILTLVPSVSFFVSMFSFVSTLPFFMFAFSPGIPTSGRRRCRLGRDDHARRVGAAHLPVVDDESDHILAGHIGREGRMHRRGIRQRRCAACGHGGERPTVRQRQLLGVARAATVQRHSSPKLGIEITWPVRNSEGRGATSGWLIAITRWSQATRTISRHGVLSG